MNLTGYSTGQQSAAQANAADEALFAEATRAWEAGEPEKILAKLERQLPTSRDYRLWHIHGLILRKLDRREQAIPSLRRAVELNPNAPKPVHALARTLYEAGLPSLLVYGRAVKLAPGDPEIITGMTSAAVVEGQVDAAIDGLAGVVARSPLWLEGHEILAKLRWAQRERQGFARSFDEALRIHPQSLDLRSRQITTFLAAEFWEDAQRAIAEGRAAMGEHPLFTLNEAILCSERGEFDQADALFARYPNMDDASLQVRWIRHLLRAGRVEQAAAAIEPWLSGPDAFMFWPYASIAWRETDRARWEWLEGDDRFVGVYDIADRLPPLDQLADTLRRLHTLSGQPLEQSLRGGTQTEGDMFTHIDPVLVHLREAIRTTVAEHVARFPQHDPAHPLLATKRSPIRFEGAWSVRLQQQGYHANHVHPAGWISSALYIVLPPDLGRNEAGVLTLGDPSAPTFKVDVPPFRTVEPRPGRLVLFPSYMWHGTRPFAEGERITVAFDVARTA